MAIKMKYATETEIPAALKAEYKQVGNEWIADIEGAEDTGALRRALDHEKDARKLAEKTARDLKAAAEAAELEAVKAKGNVAEITSAYEKKIDDARKAQLEEKKAFERTVKKTAISEAALKLATEISTVPGLMQRMLTDRLDADVIDGVAIVQVLGADGKVSANSLEDLRKEFVDNKEYAAIIVKSKASGGGAVPAPQGVLVPGSAGPKRIAEMTALEKRAFYERDKEGFIRQRDLEQQPAT